MKIEIDPEIKKNIQEATGQTPEKEAVAKEFQPKCPTCGSPDVERITAANKVKNAALWGVFALGHLSKTFKCNNCGQKW
ncbi:MAG TPA: hypothetical protein VJ202_00470 [Thermodesulfobacteriota bacterium]|nr:hypothetical protein [Thermodesulfobacteriota bacterium]